MDLWTPQGKKKVGEIERIDVYMLPRVKQIANEKLLYNRDLSLGLWDDLEECDWGWGGMRLNREGIYVYLELTHVVVQQMWMKYYKAIIL